MISIRKVRELTLGRPSGAAGTQHISAASSLVRHRDNLYIVADDELGLAVFPAEGTEDGYMIQILEGRLSHDADARSEDKADLESVALLDAFGDHEHGALLALGSGSGPKRNRGALIPLREDGSPSDDHHLVDLDPLYAKLMDDLKDLNVEGAAVRGDVLTLLQRGNSAKGPNARIDLDLTNTLKSLEREEPLAPDSVRGISEYPLGQSHGVDLCFSDASSLHDGRLVFSCSAEDSASSGSDGATVSSAVGIMDEDGDVTTLEEIDGDVKLEGVAAYLNGEDIEIFLVTDADDPKVASPLYATEL